MGTTQFAQGEAQANPDILNAIVKASETYSIVASQDIVDVRGLKLWSKGHPVSQALQQRLLERKLQRPIEACLMAEDGVTPFYLMEKLGEFFSTDSSLARALRPWGLLLQNQLKQIPLHSVAQLLLTTGLATRPDTIPHAVQAMALAGALSQVQNSPVDIRLAMLGGLLHDIGEAYIQPLYLDSAQPLDLLGHKHMMVHPRIAQMLLSSTTDYPAALCMAVGEHHERLNGSGYPARLNTEGISPLGRLLAVVEVTSGILRAPNAPLTRASFAMRVVPGEFSPMYSSAVFNMAHMAKEELPQDRHAHVDVLKRINTTLQQAQQTAQALRTPTGSPQCQGIVNMALERIIRLRQSWNALGVWGLSPDQLTPQDHFEMELAERELQLRLRDLQRECMLLAEQLPEAEKTPLEPIWAELMGQAA
jgi:hypothetical protein